MAAKSKSKFISFREHKRKLSLQTQIITGLQQQIELLRADLGQAVFESGKHLDALQKSVGMMDDDRQNISSTRQRFII